MMALLLLLMFRLLLIAFAIVVHVVIAYIVFVNDVRLALMVQTSTMVLSLISIVAAAVANDVIVAVTINGV